MTLFNTYSSSCDAKLILANRIDNFFNCLLLVSRSSTSLNETSKKFKKQCLKIVVLASER